MEEKQIGNYSNQQYTNLLVEVTKTTMMITADYINGLCEEEQKQSEIYHRDKLMENDEYVMNIMLYQALYQILKGGNSPEAIELIDECINYYPEIFKKGPL